MEMDTDEGILLRRWISDRDADAFVQVAMRHAKMVYGVALRVLGNSHDAEEVAQDCFETLASTRKPPKDNLSGWLYQVAANQAISRVRSERRRQDREERFLAELPKTSDVSWDDIHCYVDEAILALPDLYREPLVAHFFEQQTHDAIAQRLGLARSSVSHRIQQGIEAVRQRLKKRGITVTMVAIGTWFDAQAAEIVVPSARLTETIARIGVAGVGGTAITSSGVSLLGKLGVIMSTKWVAGGIVAALVVGSVLFLGSRSPQVPAPVPAPSVPVTSEKENIPAETPVLEASKAVESVSSPVTTPPATPVSDDPLASLWGFWLVGETASPDASMKEEVDIRKENSNIVIHPLDPNSGLKMTGPIHGFQLLMTVKGGGVNETLFSGVFTPNANSFALSGNLNFDPPQLATLFFTRVQGDSQTAEHLKKKLQRKEEVQAIYSALHEYKKNFGDKYPERLEEAARFLKGDITLFAASPGREITYKPKELENPKSGFSEDMLQWESEVQYADQIVAAEAQLHKNGLYDSLCQPALVSIKYSNPQQRVSVTRLGRIIDEGYDVPLSDEDAEKCLVACQNNLKQFGVVMAMFSHEHHGFIPGGWAMTFPEYLCDPAMFSCPSQALGSDSYELLFPGVAEESFCRELYEKVTGESADNVNVQSMVPLVAERSSHTVRGKQRRNVLFFDGHVESVVMSDLPQKVDRFVKANK